MHASETDDGGFTLIELMVVVLIIAVLLAIAIPTFLGSKKKANDRAVQANLRTAFAATRVFYDKTQDFTADPDEMEQVEPSLAWTNALPGSAASSSTIYIATRAEPAAGQTVLLVGRSRSGLCYSLRDTMAGLSAGTHFLSRAEPNEPCEAPATDDADWAETWS